MQRTTLQHLFELHIMYCTKNVTTDHSFISSGENNSNGSCTFIQSEWESDPSIERCVEYDWAIMIIAAIYMLLSNLLLVNLVIALFRYNYKS